MLRSKVKGYPPGKVRFHLIDCDHPLCPFVQTRTFRADRDGDLLLDDIGCVQHFDLPQALAVPLFREVIEDQAHAVRELGTFPWNQDLDLVVTPVGEVAAADQSLRRD